jgi:hypothetical protein
VTERFNANSEGTNISSSGIGPAGSGSSLVTLGLGQGPGQTANNQENNQFAQFEYPIKWDDVANALGRLGEKQKVDELLDDMSTRDRVLEDYLNTNVVNGIVAGSRVTIDRAAGVVTITATDQIAALGAWTTFTPGLTGQLGGVATITNNASAYIKLGSIVIARASFTATFAVAQYPTTMTNFPFSIKAAGAAGTTIGTGYSRFDITMFAPASASTTASITINPGTPSNQLVWDTTAITTYEAA